MGLCLAHRTLLLPLIQRMRHQSGPQRNRGAVKDSMITRGNYDSKPRIPDDLEQIDMGLERRVLSFGRGT